MIRLADASVMLSIFQATFPTTILAIASYVLTSMALYAMAKRRGIHKPWLAWVPVFNCWILGSLSDQYRYVVRGENRSKRRWLLALKLMSTAADMVVTVMSFGTVMQLLGGAVRGAGMSQVTRILLTTTLRMSGWAGLFTILAVAYAVIKFMALYDVYRSMAPDSATTFLVLSILFRITAPFFLFVNRELDMGMPPRRDI